MFDHCFTRKLMYKLSKPHSQEDTSQCDQNFTTDISVEITRYTTDTKRTREEDNSKRSNKLSNQDRKRNQLSNNT